MAHTAYVIIVMSGVIMTCMGWSLPPNNSQKPAVKSCPFNITNSTEIIIYMGKLNTLIKENKPKIQKIINAKVDDNDDDDNDDEYDTPRKNNKKQQKQKCKGRQKFFNLNGNFSEMVFTMGKLTTLVGQTQVKGISPYKKSGLRKTTFFRDLFTNMMNGMKELHNKWRNHTLKGGNGFWGNKNFGDGKNTDNTGKTQPNGNIQAAHDDVNDEEDAGSVQEPAYNDGKTNTQYGSGKKSTWGQNGGNKQNWLPKNTAGQATSNTPDGQNPHNGGGHFPSHTEEHQKKMDMFKHIMGNFSAMLVEMGNLTSLVSKRQMDMKTLREQKRNSKGSTPTPKVNNNEWKVMRKAHLPEIFEAMGKLSTLLDGSQKELFAWEQMRASLKEKKESSTAAMTPY
ncbi:uncharacterized protein LOC131952451 isoform X2 [Physella acuta]|uniref:uncharacterized protein LOC131952451 isoform X2 n=1 Tax=Physella acuta TaxID=109671 RepID=UPI0027DC7B46|nr:uncharacterized protein LOC131952451 isoform X2 [Physella acuta]